MIEKPLDTDRQTRSVTDRHTETRPHRQTSTQTDTNHHWPDTDTDR